jgi:NAD(P)-dependent dehydrogenase (short-subunit alcohol dehydrogenase family)
MKIVLITGGSKGLGKSLVHKYLENDYKVIEFSRSGHSKDNLKCDFTDHQSFPKIFSSTLSEIEKSKTSEIVLINNAGTIEPIGPISEFKIQDWINHINTNFTSAVITTGLFIKHFQSMPCAKSIAFISSGAALRPKYGWSLYCASKAGLDQFCRSISIEQESQNNPISCVIIDPDIIDTEMQSKIRATDSTLFPESQRFKLFKSDGLLRSPKSVAEKIYTIISNPIKNGHRYSVDDV